MNISPLTTVDSQAVSSALDEFGNQVQDVLNQTSSLSLPERVKVFITQIGPQLLWALVILIVGLVAVRIVMRFVARGLAKSKIDPAAHSILKSLTKFGLYLVVVTCVCGALKIDLTMFVAVVSILGLALSLAVKDSLANFASGILLVFSHPFTIGNFIETESVSGTVAEIGLIYTRLNTVDNKHIYIPNGQLSSAKIINYSAEERRQVDLIFSISYTDSPELAKKLLLGLIEDHPLALKDPAPLVRVKEYASSSVNIICRVWVKSEHYWDLYYDLVENARRRFDENGITIPYNQLDVHIIPAPDEKTGE